MIDGVAALRQEAYRADRHFSNASKFQSLKLCIPFETYPVIHTKLTATKNGVAALRQEAYRADRHFFNASNDPFEAIIS